MKKSLYKTLLLSLSLAVAMPAFAALSRVGDFALLDNHGYFHQLSRYQHKKALVIMSYVQSCPASESLLERFQAMQSQWENQGITFLLLDSMDLDRGDHSQLPSTLPILRDDGQLVSETLGISHAGEVLVLRPERGSLLYQGPLLDELDQVLNDTLAGTINNTVRREIDGCAIEFAARDQHQANTPDYATEVAPIIIENCSECHRQSGPGPFALDSHIMLMGWSPMIREVLLNKRMPPTQIDPHIGFSPNARYISNAKMQTVIHWIDAGAPRGESDIDPLENLDFSARKVWQLGEPDYIVEGISNVVSAVGVLDYVYASAALPFEEDKWLRAVQYQAGDESVLHHLVSYITAPDEDFWGPERDQLSATRRFVEAYAPGKVSAVEFPANTGVLIPKGHKLSMQFHYVSNGRATIDATKIGLYFYDQAPAHELLTQVVSNRTTIPANNPRFAVVAEHVMASNVVITGVRAHMHFRGRDMKFVLQHPDGSRRDLLSVPAYNYGWQPNYRLAESVPAAAGSRVIIEGAFDNSVSNPSNPNPDKEVGFGLDSWDEMFSGYITFHYSD